MSKIPNQILKFLDLISYVKRDQIIRPKFSPVFVNIGSSLFVAKGWINIDVSHHALFSKYPSPFLKVMYANSPVIKQLYPSFDQYVHILRNHYFVYHDVTYGLPFLDESVDQIYSSHFLEHVFRNDATKILEGCYRVLKWGGIIRISVPDLDYAISLFNHGDKEAALKCFYSTFPSGDYSSHKWMYDFNLLKSLLEECNFKNIQKCSYHQSKLNDIEQIEKRAECSIFIEAIKEPK